MPGTAKAGAVARWRKRACNSALRVSEVSGKKPSAPLTPLLESIAMPPLAAWYSLNSPACVAPGHTSVPVDSHIARDALRLMPLAAPSEE